MTDKARAIRIEKFGGPDVLEMVDVDVPPPAGNEVRIRHTAIGVNFIDIYHRTGLYPVPLPSGLGSEAVGIVEAAGEAVTDFKAGDRIVYTGGVLDSYSEIRNYPAERAVKLPDAIDDKQAAASFLKGMTAWYLLHGSYRVRVGDPILIYAAAGGVGSIATQWARQIGAFVIGIVSSSEKAALAASLGCDEVVLADHQDIPGEVKRLTGGDGVAAVYDSVGKDTFMQSLDCLRPHGVMVSFGNASGAVEPFAPAELAKRHSLFVTRPVLYDFISTRDALLEVSQALFRQIADGNIRVDVNQEYPLSDAAQAQIDLAARKTTGSTVLLP